MDGERLDLDAILEAHINVGRVGTHFQGCYLQHRPCAIAALVAEVRRLRAEVNDALILLEDREYGD